ncbi:hypothetical protein VNI00_006607 [Paramarasmius palmivorus]|uniref:Uncharacterized protein n=1 Tax=Paramarasmius palmivorus TaxID=297713 RepID=A0AAW0D4F9_9AGAR
MSSNQNGRDSDDAFNPLFLAFLGIGLFTASMVALVGWRRVQRRAFQSNMTPPLQGGFSYGIGIGAGWYIYGYVEEEKEMRQPELFDLWCEKKGTTASWDSAKCVPISASALPDEDQSKTPINRNKDRRDSDSSTNTIAMMKQRFGRMRPSPTSADIESNLSPGTGTRSPEPASSEERQLQVAVVIEMPRRNEHEKTQRDYAIGLYRATVAGYEDTT